MNTKFFYKTYPLVFPDGEPKCGFHCGDGWYQLLDSLFFVIQKDLEKEPENQRNFIITQIKEKFGQLRVYCNGSTSYINQTITQAEEMSRHICETCGEYGELRDSAHWIKVRCDACEKKHFANRHQVSKEVKKSIKEGIYLGNFSQYADDDDE